MVLTRVAVCGYSQQRLPSHVRALLPDQKIATRLSFQRQKKKSKLYVRVTRLRYRSYYHIESTSIQLLLFFLFK